MKKLTPTFKLGDIVIVRSAEDEQVLYQREIKEAEYMPETGWRYWVAIDKMDRMMFEEDQIMPL